MNEETEIVLAGKTYTIPALNFENLEQVEKHIIAMRANPAMTFTERISHVVPVVLASINQIASPPITEADLKKALTLKNFNVVLAAVMGVNGLVRDEQVDAAAGVAATGESKPVTAVSTGPKSTDQ